MAQTEADQSDVIALGREQMRWRHYRKHLKIEDRRSGTLIPFVPNVIQQQISDLIDEKIRARMPVRFIVLKSRRMGVSTIIQARFAHLAFTSQRWSAITGAHEMRSSTYLHSMAEQMYDHLPAPLQRKKAVGLQGRRIEFVEGSGLTTFTAGSGDSVGRGGGFRGIHASELAFWDDAEGTLLSLRQTVAAEPGTIIAIESTANGLNNGFHREWIRAKEGVSEYVALFYAWFEFPDYQMPLDDRVPGCYDGRLDPDYWREADYPDEADAEEEILRGMGCTEEQLAWRRYTLVNSCGEDLDKFKQEYPACLTGEMRVSTERGIIPIRDAAGSMRTESGPIDRFGAQPPSQIWKLTTRRGRILRGTADHPISLPDGRLVGLADLEAGEPINLRPPMFAERELQVTKPGPLGSQTTITVTQELGRFVGYFMGDGSWYNGTLSMACDAQDLDVVEDVRALVTRFIAPPTSRVISRVQGRKGAIELRVGRKEARDAMLQLGLIWQGGREDAYKRKVHVPEIIWRSPRPVVRAFLQGLFEADGSASGKAVRWASSKHQFALDVQLLLLGFGINASLTQNEKTAGSGHTYQPHVLQMTGDAARLFHDEIGFIGERKRSGRIKKNGNVGRPNSGLEMIDEVASVEPDGFEQTYDFAIGTDDHLFQAQGILTHNTDTEAFLASGNPFFPPALQARLARVTKAPSGRGDITGVPRANGRLAFVPSRRGPLHVFEPPGRGPYLIGADSAGGISEEEQKARDAEGDRTRGDYNAAVVVDLSTGRTVADFQKKTDADLFAEDLARMGWMYRTPDDLPAEIAVESNGQGLLTLSKLRDEWSYPRIYHREALSHEYRNRRTRTIGWVTGAGNRGLILANLREIIRERPDMLPSRRLLDQVRTFIQVSNTRYEHAAGAHDDMVFAYSIAYYLFHLRSHFPVSEAALPTEGPQSVADLEAFALGFRDTAPRQQSIRAMALQKGPRR